MDLSIYDGTSLNANSTTCMRKLDQRQLTFDIASIDVHIIYIHIYIYIYYIYILLGVALPLRI